jgi:hypothetical protein
MPVKRINQIISDLPFERKLLGAGAILMAISTFLPWYQDLDSFKTGDVFLGLSGPTYLAGLTILAVAIIDILLVFVESSEKKMPLISIKPSTFYLASGLISFYLLLMVNSIYFHNKFGVNITSKDSQFGMFMAFIAASLMTIGGYLATREKSSILKEFQEKAQEPMIKLPDQNELRKAREITRPAPVQMNKPVKATQTMIADNAPGGVQSAPMQRTQAMPVQKQAASPVQKPYFPNRRSEPYPSTAPVSNQRPEVIPGAPAPKEMKPYQPYRTDL